MAYVINPNGKDVWLRDNADTMDISPATDASSVYLENGRNIEQELSGTLKSEVVTVDSAIEKIVEGTLDGAYQECMLKGDTKWVDVDSGEILDEFIEGRNLELRGVESPSVTNTTESMPIMDGLICWLDGRDEVSGVDRLGNVYSHKNVIIDNKSLNSNNSNIAFDSIIGNLKECCFEFLIKRNETNHWGRIFSLYEPTNDSSLRRVITFQSGDSDTNKLRYYDFNVSKAIIINKTSVLQDNNFHHIYIQFNPCRVFLNGIDTTELSENIDNIDFLFSSVSVFSDLDYSNPIKCNMGMFRIYNRILTEEEIQHNYLYEQSIDRESNTSSISSQQQNTLTTPQDMTLHKVNNICDTYNAITGEYTQYIGERVYQVGDEANANVITDMTKTLYVLDNPITTIVEPNIIPFAYENGYVSLDSANGILPTLEYATTISRMGQVTSNGLIIRKQEQQITNLEKMLIQGIVNMNYNNALLNLDLKL